MHNSTTIAAAQSGNGSPSAQSGNGLPATRYPQATSSRRARANIVLRQALGQVSRKCHSTLPTLTRPELILVINLLAKQHRLGSPAYLARKTIENDPKARAAAALIRDIRRGRV